MNPIHVWRLWGAPCVHCGQPALAVEVFPNGRHVIHADRSLGHCTDTNPPARTPQETPK